MKFIYSYGSLFLEYINGVNVVIKWIFFIVLNNGERKLFILFIYIVFILDC